MASAGGTVGGWGAYTEFMPSVGGLLAIVRYPEVMIMTMTLKGSSKLLALVGASLLAVACSDDGLAPEGANDETGGTTNAGTTSQVDSTSIPPPESTGNDGVDVSTSGPGPVTGDDTGSTSIEPPDLTTTTDGTTTTDDTTTTGETDTGTTTGGVAAYEGSYDGNWSGMCLGLGAVAGTLMFDVAADGTLAGSIAGTDSGPLDGTVDDMGAVSATATGMLAGMCPFDGQIDMMGDVTGMWSCAAFGCSGTWTAQVN